MKGKKAMNNALSNESQISDMYFSPAITSYKWQCRKQAKEECYINGERKQLITWYIRIYTRMLHQWGKVATNN